MARTDTSLAERLRDVTLEIRALEEELKSQANPEMLPLEDFRVALDNARLTAWAVSELVNAHQQRNNPQQILLFLASQRVRRFTQMATDMCTDTKSGEINAETNGLDTLRVALHALQECLGQLKKS